MARTILREADRCDRCGARAYFRVNLAGEPESPTLDFCRHHWRKYSETMTDTGWKVVCEPE